MHCVICDAYMAARIEKDGTVAKYCEDCEESHRETMDYWHSIEENEDE